MHQERNKGNHEHHQDSELINHKADMKLIWEPNATVDKAIQGKGYGA